MTATPLVSVIVPFLDVAPFLAETIESVRAQTYANWELLLCDDGSTDGSSDIARAYAQADPARIRHLTHDGPAPQGSSAARNLGLRHARGTLIALLDGDDVWLPNKLAEQVEIMRQHPEADALYGLTELWYSWTGAASDAGRDHVPPSGAADGTLLGPHMLLSGMLRRELLVPCTCSVVVRSDAVRRAGGFASEFPGMHDDVAFYSRLSLVGSVLFVERQWDRYRQRPTSTYATVRREGEGRRARLSYLTWLEGVLATSPAGEDRTLRATLRAALRRERHPRLFAVIDGVRNGLRRARR